MSGADRLPAVRGRDGDDMSAGRAPGVGDYGGALPHRRRWRPGVGDGQRSRGRTECGGEDVRGVDVATRWASNDHLGQRDCRYSCSNCCCLRHRLAARWSTIQEVTCIWEVALLQYHVYWIWEFQ